GLLLTVLAVLLLTAWPAWHHAAIRLAQDARQARPSRVVRLLASWRARPTTLAGAQMALEPGRGPSAVPVRSTLVGVAVGIGALIAALTFSASLSHLLDTPHLYGVTWDGELTNYGAGPDLPTVGAQVLRNVPGVTAIAAGDADIQLTVQA